jgi:tetratricopeptide (TPR) repeat protein
MFDNTRRSIALGGMLLALALAVTSLFAASTPGLNQSGLAHYDRGDYAAAQIDFRQALERDPGNAVLKQNLALAINGEAVGLSQTGQGDRAVEKLKEALALAGDHPAIRRNLAVTRINLATEALERKDAGAAQRLLDEAGETATAEQRPLLDERRAQAWIIEARQFQRDNQTDRAMRAVRHALQLAPDNVAAMIIMGDLYYKMGDNINALTYWSEARDLNGSIEGLDEQIERVIREQAVEGKFERRSNQSFTVFYDATVDPASIQTILDILRDAYDEIGRSLRFLPDQHIPVVVYSRFEYSNVTVAPDWSSALYDGKIRVPLPEGGLRPRDREQLRQTLHHEYAHAVVHQLSGAALPAWINEGVACWFELPEDARAKRNVEETRQLRAALLRGDPLTASGLPDLFTTISDKGGAERAYRISRVFTAWLIDRQRMNRLRQTLDAVADGLTLDEAFEKVYRKSIKELETEWVEELKKG